MSEEIDPQEFQQRIRQLGEQRDQQDAARAKKLEDDLMASRSERLARRADRARSISPDKPQSLYRSSVHTPQQVQEQAASTPTPAMSPPQHDDASAREESLQQLTSAPAPDDGDPQKPTSAAALGRSGTLSWKQRPQSGSTRRPLSVARPSSRDASAPASPERPLSRTQIAASLGAKDPTYFRQTADRGVGSAAYRKNEDDNASDAGSISKRQLPGMSRDSTISRESTASLKAPELASPASESTPSSRPTSRGGSTRGSTAMSNRFSTATSTKEPELASLPTESTPSSRPTSRGGSTRGSIAMSNRFSAATSMSGGELDTASIRSPLPTLESQKFAPPSEQGATGESGDSAGAAREPFMSPTQGRISPERERSTSPTKGMGSFVLSASMKRGDSVSKRWSTQTPPTPSRQGSSLSNRSSAMSGFGTLSKLERPTSLSREQSADDPPSRPQSSSSNTTMRGLSIDVAPKDEFVRPAIPNRHSRSKSVHSTFSNRDSGEDGDRPSTPSKRWSPSKSSWLENALNKPESPKLMAPASPSQPAWMAELSRAKQQRGSVDLGKGSPIMTPFGEKLESRPASPLKEVHLRPVGLRKTLDSPKLDSPKLDSPPKLDSLKKEPAKLESTKRVPAKLPSPELEPTKLQSPKLESPNLESPTLDALKLDHSKFDPFGKEEPKLSQISPLQAPVAELRPSSPLKEEIKPSDKTEDVEEPKHIEKAVPVEVESTQPEAKKAEPETPMTPVDAPEKDKEIAASPAPTKSVLSRFPPAVNAKPNTPPKKDFRAGLKSRQAAQAESPKSQSAAQSELQNVFGKLRKAETKNFVAPDVFKANIVGGKNALNITGGPKPTVRRDEFRESLKEKRSSMLDKAQEEGSTLKRSESISKPAEIPEAIAIRGRLDRSKSISKFPIAPKEEEKKPIPEALARKKSLRGIERPNLDMKDDKPASPAPLFAQKFPPKEEEKKPVSEALARRKSLRGIERPNLDTKDDKPASPAPLFAQKDNSKPNKLASRFNPALAGMLARGPPMATEKSTSSVGGSSPSRPAQDEPSGPAPELTHMTKGRARGPKRRNQGAKKSTPEPEKAPEKVNATVAAAPLIKPRQVLPSSEPPKANGTAEELSAREPIVETPVKSVEPRKPFARFDKAPTPVVAKKPSSIDLNRRVSGTPNTPKQSPRPDSIGEFRAESPVIPVEPRKVSAKSDKAPTPVVAKKPSLIELNRRVSGTPITSQQSPRPDSIGTPKTASPAVPKKSERISSGSYSIASQSPRPESIETPKTASPVVPKKSERISSGSYSVAQQSPKPESITSPSVSSLKSSKPESKPASPSPSTSFSSSRFSRPLPTPPPKESLKPAALREIPTPNAEVSPVKNDDNSPQKSGFSSVRAATALWGQQSAPSSPAVPKTKSPIKLPTQADEKAAMKVAGLVRSPESETAPKPETLARPESLGSKPLPPAPLQPKSKPAGLGFKLSGFGSFGSGAASRSRDPSPRFSKDLPMSPPRSADKVQPDTPKSARAPVAPKHDGMFSEFFDEAPLTEGQLPETIDAVQVLHSPPFDLGPAGKIRTQKQEIHEITGDGKMLSIASHEQHILFQDSMYICTHVYINSKGVKSTDVYLWAGNGVAESNIEDAQLFARNHARQNQAKLLTLRQGNEPPNFFDALGGIVITRRGSNPASKQFMLCGRRHLGHLAFDEVDFSLNSFCSAFVYLISTEAGKVYLWKGRGCSAEELSGARLMGMDLAPTGDFQEIDEGSEPQHLINIFPPPTHKGPAIPRSADHWRYKATSDRYRARLYKIDQQQEVSGGWGQSLQVGSFFANLRRGSFAQTLSPTSTGAHAENGPQTPITPKSPLPPGITTKVVEIMPFCQRDLEPEYIYVLDAFFEMYIIVGALARSQAPAFSTALMLAQEYGILAVSEEDRPFMPVTTIVLEGVPRDMKAVFRHWNDAVIPTGELMSGSFKRRKSLRIVGLEKAIQGTRG